MNLEEFLRPGQNAMTTRQVAPEDAVDAYGTDLRDLLATPRLIHWAIDAAIEAIDPYLPSEYASVGTSINFRQKAPSVVGNTVKVRASILAISGQEVSMKLEAWDERGELGCGTHVRVVALKEAVLRKADERTRFMRNPVRSSFFVNRKYH